MNRLIYTLAITGAVLITSVPALAQKADGQREGRMHRMEGRMERMKQAREQFAQRLGITESQKAQLQALRQSQAEQMKALREQMRAGTADRQTLRENMRRLHQERRDAMTSILTPGQQSQMAEMRRQMRERIGDRIKEGERRGKRGLFRGGGDGWKRDRASKSDG